MQSWRRTPRSRARRSSSSSPGGGAPPGVPCPASLAVQALKGFSSDKRLHADGYVFDNICSMGHYQKVKWTVLFHGAFDTEFQELSEGVQDEILAQAKLLEQFGPTLGRPRVDTLKGSRHANMKELRFDADDGVWRVAFAFDPRRRAVLLVAGDKSGGSQRRFYRELVRTADTRFDEHLENVKREKKP